MLREFGMGGILFQAWDAVIDQLNAGVVICGADGQIFHVNRSAHEMLEAGWPVRRHNLNYLRASDRARQEVLLTALGEIANDPSVTGPGQISLEIPLSSARSVRGVSMATIRPLVMQEQRLLSVFITVAAREHEPCVSGFAQCFGLTAAEARVLERIIKGSCARDAAVELGVSHNTVKTHLRNIFAKTKTTRQPELIRLFAELTPPLRRSQGRGYHKTGGRSASAGNGEDPAGFGQRHGRA
jgi:DNA-binding CsgD family transcriptional regulator